MSPNIKWIIAVTVWVAGVYMLTTPWFRKNRVVIVGLNTLVILGIFYGLNLGPEQNGTVLWIGVLMMIVGSVSILLHEKWRIHRFTKLLMRVTRSNDLRPMWELRRVPDALADCDRFGLYIPELPPDYGSVELAACRTCGSPSVYREFVRAGRTSPLVFILAHSRATRLMREGSRARGDPMTKVYLSTMMDLDRGMLATLAFCSAVCYASYQMWVYGLPATPLERRKRSRVIAVDFVRWFFQSPAQVIRFIRGRW